jgi:hypothetical protein
MAQSEEEDDYMTMVFEEPKHNNKHETSLQRAARKRREGEERSRQKTKEERKAEEEAAREAALSNALPPENKGFKMMAKFGSKHGDALGKSENARKEPIQVNIKEDKGGIGLESEKKRKFRELAEQAERDAKRTKEEELDFRESQRQEIREKKDERDFHNAQRTAERLHDKATGGKDTAEVPLKNVNVLWRGLVKYRMEKQKQKKEQHSLQNSLLARLPTYQDDDEDTDYKVALGGETMTAFDADQSDIEDSELEAFEAESFADRLDKIVLFMREKYHYCFWCAYQYPDAAMEGCPGITEGEHD